MEDGYYWYYPAPDDEGDLQDDEPHIVKVSGVDLFVMGGDWTYSINDAHGIFKGPIRPPQE